MTMFYFGIPFISKHAAVDWDKSVALLNNTLSSVAQQTDKRFRCLIACHDIPDVREEYKPFITFLPIDTPPPDSLSLMRQDKGRKKREIAVHLRQQGGGYLMFLDADDLVHKKLVEHALAQQAEHGYILKHGYMYYTGARKIMPVEGVFDQQCGSCAIFRFAPDDLPTSVEDETRYFSMFYKHATWEETARQHNRPLQPVPFPAAIYIRSPEISISGRFFPEIGVKYFKRKIKQWLRETSITPTIRTDFCLS